jgi:hypothetical protein
MILSTPVVAQPVDHHQHLFSPSAARLLGPDVAALLPHERGGPALTATRLVGYLDAAGIRGAVVLSVAYLFGSPSRKVEDEYAKVRAENDWTAAETAKYPERLRAFCG